MTTPVPRWTGGPGGCWEISVIPESNLNHQPVSLLVRHHGAEVGRFPAATPGQWTAAWHGIALLITLATKEETPEERNPPQ